MSSQAYRSESPTLAFDIIFAEGQRRFMETMSSYTRQFVEQLPEPDIDDLSGIPSDRRHRATHHTRVAKINGSNHYRSSTVFALTLRSYWRIQHSPTTGLPIQAASHADLVKKLKIYSRRQAVKKEKAFVSQPQIIRARKGAPSAACKLGTPARLRADAL